MLDVNTQLQGRYQIIRPVGEGGMGAVYLARDLRLGSTVALKETFFTDETLRKAFEREARLLAGLRHSALPKVSDHFSEGAGQFLVMEFIPGEDLEELLKRRGSPFSPEEVLAWTDQLLDALDYLHTQDPPIIHRDIKPQNLKLTDRGHIVLLDFGLAKGAAAGMTRASSNMSIFGYTPSYAPLEQIKGSGTDPRSDLYSLAATLYTLLTNATPADALTRATTVLDNHPDPLTPLCELNPGVPEAASTVLMRAMALSRDQRPASAADMRRALREATGPGYPAITFRTSPGVATPPGVSPAATQMAGSQRSVTQAAARQTGMPAPGQMQPTVANQMAKTATVSRSNRLYPIVAAVVALLVVGVIIYAITNRRASNTDANTNQNLIQQPPAANSNTPALTQTNSNASNANQVANRRETRSQTPNRQANANQAVSQTENTNQPSSQVGNSNQGRPRLRTGGMVRNAPVRQMPMPRRRNANRPDY
jgi:eukaryotic-like serine/threonine-protein kinase